MNYIRITKENIDKEHICCAMSGKQSVAKKEWLRQRFDDGLVFYRSEERGKCFIEYIPAENAWVPIEADGYLYIDCLWVSGSMKGHGYSNDLLEACIRDAKAQGKKGICILCAEGRKREFLADPKFLAHKVDHIAVFSAGEAMVVIIRHIQAGMPVIVERAEGHAIMVDLHAVPLRCIPAAYAVFNNFKKIHRSSISAQKNGGLPDLGKPPFCVLSYADFVSFSGKAGSIFASRKASFRAPCRLICAAYRQSSLQYFTSDLVVVNTLPQFSQVHARLRPSAAS